MYSYKFPGSFLILLYFKTIEFKIINLNTVIERFYVNRAADTSQSFRVLTTNSDPPNSDHSFNHSKSFHPGNTGILPKKDNTLEKISP